MSVYGRALSPTGLVASAREIVFAIVAGTPVAAPAPGSGGGSMRDMVESLERWDRWCARQAAFDPQDCYLCHAWLPCPAAEQGRREVHCAGCCAVYITFGSNWQRVLDASDAQNPYHSALHMRRYGASADYIRHLGWVVPPAWMTVRFPDEPVTR